MKFLLSPSIPSSSCTLFLFFFSLILTSSLIPLTHTQQAYIYNLQLDCYQDSDLTTTNGYICNGPQTSCLSYLTFRSQPPYDSASQISHLLRSDASAIAKINNITHVEKIIPPNTQLIVPVNCSCNSVAKTNSSFYQYNSYYTLKTETENYFTVSNDTYEGLTTCQAMINQNPHDSRQLSAGMKLLVPLRCACPSTNQTANGVNFLLSYLVTWGEDISIISNLFGVDEQAVLNANELLINDLIYPFQPILVPLKTKPTKIRTSSSPPPPPPPPLLLIPLQTAKTSALSAKGKKWVFIGIGIVVGLFLLFLSGFLPWFICYRRRKPQRLLKERDVSAVGVRHVVDSLTEYKFEELQRATGNFREDHRIKGSVYRGIIRGDNAAIKRKTSSSATETEINILKQINHSSIIRLSGFCVRNKKGNTYLVYEFAENGSLSDWLHHDKKKVCYSGDALGWKQRLQIAYDVADGLNYLHNYTNPPYIHKDLMSSNILLNGEFRAKMTNFELARPVDKPKPAEDEERGGDLILTRHVVGTRGYMAPEYLEHGLVTRKLDVFAFGVVMLELLSGKEAVNANGNASGEEEGGRVLLSESIKPVLEGENVRENLKGFIDPSLSSTDYPFDSAFLLANLAMDCVEQDVNSRPTMDHVFMCLSKIVSSSLDWHPPNELEHTRSPDELGYSMSLSHGR